MAETPKAHAPRGPIKGNPSQTANPLQTRLLGGNAPRCTAKGKRNQLPCKNPAIMGATVCRMHGGSAPQVKAKALERLMALQPKAIQTLDSLLSRDEFPTVQLGAAKDVLDRTEGKAVESVNLQVSGSLDIVGRIREARKRLQARGADPQNP